ncbi:hypothetical protein Tco_1016373 [Tanacetum coccineum]|uniref:Retrovirus-related Pol polyprotein from transposon TNT 1-94 n=1 Tax=Tanacetum coccineum TaxID=301880 RepID=A0ABQ5FPS0_9ASTR
MNSVINCETAKSTWEDLILYHEGPFDVKESRVMDLKLCYNTFKFKEENLIDNIYETEKKKSLATATPLSNAFFLTSIVQDFQDSSNDEEDTRSSSSCQKHLNQTGMPKNSGKQEVICKRLLVPRDFSIPSYQSPFQSKSLSSPQHKPELRPTKDFEAKYNKDEEEVSSDNNEIVEVKVLMALAEDNDAVSKEGARNGEWIKISMRKVHTLFKMEDNDDRKTFLDYLCIDLNYVEEQRNNLLSKHRDLIQELNKCKE